MSIYDHPHRTELWTLLAFCALYAGSVLGTYLGYKAERWLETR
jgi:hypothetical protein